MKIITEKFGMDMLVEIVLSEEEIYNLKHNYVMIEGRTPINGMEVEIIVRPQTSREERQDASGS